MLHELADLSLTATVRLQSDMLVPRRLVIEV